MVLNRAARRQMRREGTRDAMLRRKYKAIAQMEDRAMRMGFFLGQQNIVEAAFHLTYDGQNLGDKLKKKQQVVQSLNTVHKPKPGEGGIHVTQNDARRTIQTR